MLSSGHYKQGEATTTSFNKSLILETKVAAGVLLFMFMSLCENSRRRAHDAIAHSDGGKERRPALSRALCCITNSTNSIQPVFLAPFRLYCKLVRMPGQRCSSAPWAPCRMQPSYRSFTVHHGVWFWLVGFHSKTAATSSLLGGQLSVRGTMFLLLSPSGNRLSNFSHTNNDFL